MRRRFAFATATPRRGSAPSPRPRRWRGLGDGAAVPSLALTAGATAALLPLAKSRSDLTDLVLLGSAVAFVGLTVLGLLAGVSLLRAASCLPGVIVDGLDEPVLVPVLRALRDHASPESGDLLARLLRDPASASKCIYDRGSTSGRLLPDLAVLLTRAPREDRAFLLDVARVITALPLDAEWLPGATRPIEELRERRGDLLLLLRDLDAGVPEEWALRRFVTGRTEA